METGKISKKLAIFIVVIFIGFIYVLFMSHKNSTSATSQTKPTQEDMKLAVKQSTLALANGNASMGNQPVFTIENLNSFDWHDCTFTLNGTYTSPHWDSIKIPSELGASATGTDSSIAVIITESNFTKSDGTRFNSSIQTPLKFEAVCQSPYLGVYDGSWQ